MNEANTVSATHQRLILHEDWVAVVLGSVGILAALTWFTLPTPVYGWSNVEVLSRDIFSAANGTKIVYQFVYFFIFGSVGMWLTGKSLVSFAKVFPVVYGCSLVAMILAGNSQVKNLNLEAVIFSLAIGLAIGNLFRLPTWFREVLATELFVKTGLVLLGTSVIFTDILESGSLGLLQALIVVLAVWYFAFWLCRRLKLDDEMTMMISSAVSICGVSAAIATAGAIKGDNKKLSYVISLVLIVAIPMMIFMPIIAHYFGFSQEVTGAWLGGSIDTTGAVVASGTLVGDTALKISTIVKFSQNVLLGIAAFAISLYWTYAENKKEQDPESKPSLNVIWERFPKFVIGFVLASLLFSFIISPEAVGSVKGSLKNVQTWWFVLAFTSIGLETKFSDLFNAGSRKPLYAFLVAQLFNIVVTLAVAYWLFG